MHLSVSIINGGLLEVGITHSHIAGAFLVETRTGDLGDGSTGAGTEVGSDGVN